MRISVATAYGIILFIVLMIFEIKYSLPNIKINPYLTYISTLGINIFTNGNYFMIMIILAVLILSSMIGAFYLSGRDDEE